MKQANDNRSRRPCCYLIGAHHVWGRRLSGRAELRCKGAAMGDQTISAKIRVVELHFETAEGKDLKITLYIKKYREFIDKATNAIDQ